MTTNVYGDLTKENVRLQSNLQAANAAIVMFEEHMTDLQRIYSSTYKEHDATIRKAKESIK